MSSKKPQRRQSKPRSAGDDLEPPMFDRRGMEQMMAQISKLMSQQEFSSIEEANAFLQGITASGQIPAAAAETPIEQAQELMYQAWNASGKRRVELARRALELSKDCADAYVLLAEEAARTAEEARELYEEGVKAGERALGPRAFKDDVGHFWGVIETRPYMRARAGLAACLWILGERRQAIEHYTELLRLNPNDNQGIRYTLALCLLEEGDDKALDRLLKQYKEDASAVWLYHRALLTFRQSGAAPKANKALRDAIAQNPFVPRYLLGKKKLPRQRPPYIGFGDESEAVDYAAGAISAWQKTPGALEWLASQQE